MYTLPEGVWHTDYKTAHAELRDVIRRMARLGDVLDSAHATENQAVLRAGCGHLYFYGEPKGERPSFTAESPARDRILAALAERYLTYADLLETVGDTTASRNALDDLIDERVVIGRGTQGHTLYLLAPTKDA